MTAYERGWSKLKNGELLDEAEKKGFEVLVTTDLKLRYQQVGGRLTDLDGRPGIYGSTVFASNRLLHDAALSDMRTGRR